MPLPHPDRDLWRLMVPMCAEQDGLEEAEIVELLRRCATERAGSVDLRIRRTEWASVFRFNRRLVGSYRCGRVLLVGDAAHIHSPLVGQGLNTCISDAENLVFKLALMTAGRAGSGLLDTYHSERRRIAKSVLSTTGTEIGFAETLAGRRAFASLAPLLALPAVQRHLLRAASQLGVADRNGRLAAQPARCFLRQHGRSRAVACRTPPPAIRAAGTPRYIASSVPALISAPADSHFREADTRLSSISLFPGGAIKLFPRARPVVVVLLGGFLPVISEGAGSLVGSVAGAVHEDVVAGVDEPVQQGFGDDGVGEQGIPVGRGSVAGQDQ